MGEKAGIGSARRLAAGGLGIAREPLGAGCAWALGRLGAWRLALGAWRLALGAWRSAVDGRRLRDRWSSRSSQPSRSVPAVSRPHVHRQPTPHPAVSRSSSRTTSHSARTSFWRGSSPCSASLSQ
ncbi:hypothetical protein C2U71_20660 [Burkholderia ubonensis]|nr:hypothetical protein C2U71_20660 [Burkholderia ubonensis]